MNEKPLYICAHKRNNFICADCLHHHPHEKKMIGEHDICLTITRCVVTENKECICVPIDTQLVIPNNGI